MILQNVKNYITANSVLVRNMVSELYINYGTGKDIGTLTLKDLINTPEDLGALYTKIEVYLNQSKLLENNIIDININDFADSSAYLLNANSNLVNVSDMYVYPFYKSIDKNYIGVQYFPSYEWTFYGGENIRTYAFVINIWDINNAKAAGNFIVNFRTDGIGNSFGEYSNLLEGTVMILQKDGRVLYDSSGKYYGRVYPDMNNVSTTGKAVIDGLKCFITTLAINDSGYIAVGIIPSSIIWGGIADTLIVSAHISTSSR